MINRIFLGVFAGLLFAFLYGCAPGKLTDYADKKWCTTTLEGNYYKQTTTEYFPAVYLKMPKAPKLLKGEIISIDSAGVLFDPENVGFYDEEETLYPYDTLYGIIDEEGAIVYGDIPDFYAIKQELLIGITKQDNDEHSVFLLHPNEPFAFCIDPGEYKISDIKFIQNKYIIDEGYGYPQFSFNIEEGKVNYIGNIFADYKTQQDSNVIVIPCTRSDEHKTAAIGLVTGVVGAAAYTIANSLDNMGLHHIIHLEADSSFLPEAKKPVSAISLKVSFGE